MSVKTADQLRPGDMFAREHQVRAIIPLGPQIQVACTDGFTGLFPWGEDSIADVAVQDLTVGEDIHVIHEVKTLTWLPDGTINVEDTHRCRQVFLVTDSIELVEAAEVSQDGGADS